VALIYISTLYRGSAGCKDKARHGCGAAVEFAELLWRVEENESLRHLGIEKTMPLAASFPLFRGRGDPGAREGAKFPHYFPLPLFELTVVEFFNTSGPEW
jgi:hypothetical protein